jgi:hypothetical protein
MSETCFYETLPLPGVGLIVAEQKIDQPTGVHPPGIPLSFPQYLGLSHGLLSIKGNPGSGKIYVDEARFYQDEV